MIGTDQIFIGQYTTWNMTTILEFYDALKPLGYDPQKVMADLDGDGQTMFKASDGIVTVNIDDAEGLVIKYTPENSENTESEKAIRETSKKYFN